MRQIIKYEGTNKTKQHTTTNVTKSTIVTIKVKKLKQNCNFKALIVVHERALNNVNNF